jgi:nucleoside-diphosphate-sugar epimerase
LSICLGVSASFENNIKMKYFITGASGYVGSALVSELIAAGHQVIGLARSEVSASKIEFLGAQVLRGTLTDLDIIKKGASEADGVAHLGFIHDFSNFENSCKVDLEAILAMSSVMQGTYKPLIASFGVLFLPSEEGRPATENDFTVVEGVMGLRARNERLLLEQAQYGVDTMSIRLSPTTYGNGDAGFMAVFVAAAKKHGRSAYIGDGSNVWPACHRSDTVRLYRSALEKPIAGKVLHAVHQQGVPWKDFASTIGDQLKLPTVSISKEEAPAHFGFLAMFVDTNALVSSELTQKQFNWKPQESGLIADLKQGHYFADDAPSKYAV